MDANKPLPLTLTPPPGVPEIQLAMWRAVLQQRTRQIERLPHRHLQSFANDIMSDLLRYEMNEYSKDLEGVSKMDGNTENLFEEVDHAAGEYSSFLLTKQSAPTDISADQVVLHLLALSYRSMDDRLTCAMRKHGIDALRRALEKLQIIFSKWESHRKRKESPKNQYLDGVDSADEKKRKIGARSKVSFPDNCAIAEAPASSSSSSAGASTAIDNESSRVTEKRRNGTKDAVNTTVGHQAASKKKKSCDITEDAMMADRAHCNIFHSNPEIELETSSDSSDEEDRDDESYVDSGDESDVHVHVTNQKFNEKKPNPSSKHVESNSAEKHLQTESDVEDVPSIASQSQANEMTPNGEDSSDQIELPGKSPMIRYPPSAGGMEKRSYYVTDRAADLTSKNESNTSSTAITPMTINTTVMKAGFETIFTSTSTMTPDFELAEIDDVASKNESTTLSTATMHMAINTTAMKDGVERDEGLDMHVLTLTSINATTTTTDFELDQIDEVVATPVKPSDEKIPAKSAEEIPSLCGKAKDKEATTSLTAASSTTSATVEMTKSTKRLTKLELKRAKAEKAKVEHDRLLANIERSVKENSYAKYTGVEIIVNDLKNNKTRGYLSGKENWGGKLIALHTVDGKPMLVVETALVNDFGKRIDYSLEPFADDEAKLAHLKQIMVSGPDYVACEATSIPAEIIARATSTRYNDKPFNFTNPSDVNAAWNKEVKDRGLTGAGAVFTAKRKSDIFKAVVGEIIKKLAKKDSVKKRKIAKVVFPDNCAIALATVTTSFSGDASMAIVDESSKVTHKRRNGTEETVNTTIDLQVTSKKKKIDEIANDSKNSEAADDAPTSSEVLKVKRGSDPPSRPPKNSSMQLNHSQVKSAESKVGNATSTLNIVEKIVKKSAKQMEKERKNSIKVTHDDKLRQYMGSSLLEQYRGVELCLKGLKHNSTKMVKSGGMPAWGNKKLNLASAAGVPLMATEAAYSFDVAGRLSYDLVLENLPTDMAKVAKLRALKADPPTWMYFNEQSISRDIQKAMASNRNSTVFNFPNPSTVNAVWANEFSERAMNGSVLFTDARKKNIFDAVVDEIIKKLDD